jgi:hypothetical protein
VARVFSQSNAGTAIKRRDPAAARTAVEIHVVAAHESARIAFDSERKPKEELPADETPRAAPRILLIDDALWKRIAALLPDAKPRRSPRIRHAITQSPPEQ